MGLNDVFNKVAGTLNDGHTTSGLDAVMQAQANKLHPVTPQTKTTQSDKPFVKPATIKPAGGYSLKLPGDQ